jgi:hypothetical protein
MLTTESVTDRHHSGQAEMSGWQSEAVPRSARGAVPEQKLIRRSRNSDHPMWRLMLGVLSLLLSPACDTRIEGAMFWGQDGTPPPYSNSPCTNSLPAVRDADRLALLWATMLDSLDVASYADVVEAARGRRACILEQPALCSATDGSGHSSMANGCGGSAGFWVAETSSDGRPRNWHLSILHELSHVIASRLGLLDSWAHSEPIHAIAEPMVIEACGIDCKY